MTIYKGSQKQKDIYIGNDKISKIYKGSTLVYSPQQIILNKGDNGTIEGIDFWEGYIYIDRQCTGKITYPKSYPQGLWKFTITTNVQQRTSNVSLVINANYEDGTTEQVFLKNDFPKPNSDNLTTWTFDIPFTKNWIGYEVIATSYKASNKYCYMSVYIRKAEYKG